MTSQDNRVLILGAGALGVHVVDYLTGKFPLRLVVRDASKVDKFKSKAEVVVGDLKDKEFMKSAFTDVHTVISIVGNGVSPQPLLDQNDIIELAAKSGVKHFIPALFSPRLSDAPPGVLTEYLGAKEEGLRRVKNSGMTWTALYAGCFTEVWFGMAGFDFANNKANFLGEGDNILPWLTYQDVAQYIALSVNNLKVVNKEFLLGTENLSYKQIHQIVEKVTGRKFEVNIATANDLLTEYEKSTSASEFERGFLGLKVVVSRLGPTNLDELKAAYPTFKTTTTITQFAEGANKK